MRAPAELVRPLFSDAVVVVEGDPRRTWPDSALFPEEEAAVARALDKRRREFTAGRTFARRALVQLGLPAAPIPLDDQRAPVWPPGVVGTISHTARWCVAALAPASALASLGADVEEVGPLDPNVSRMVCSPDELVAVESLGDPDDWAKVVFCAKECLYKAQFPLSRTFLGFEAVSVELVPDTAEGGSGRFAARFEVSAGPFRAGQRLDGRFRREAGLWATALELPHTALPLGP